MGNSHLFSGFWIPASAGMTDSDSPLLLCDGGDGLVFEFDGDTFGYAGLLHGYAVEDVGNAHGSLGVSDDNELAVSEELLNQGIKPLVVGFIQRGIDLIENAQGADLGTEDGKEQGHSSHGLFSAGE